MAQLSKDLQLDETKFNNASRDMKVLKKRTNELKTKLEGMYESLASAMDTPAGKEVQLEAKKTLLKPVEPPRRSLRLRRVPPPPRKTPPFRQFQMLCRPPRPS